MEANPAGFFMSKYRKPFRQNEERYIDGTSFEQILDVYIFDRKLRILIFDAIEQIEIACRNIITSSMCALKVNCPAGLMGKMADKAVVQQNA